ncbi:porin [Agrobacterium genomosp. 3]|uniref:Porin n=2 Tax=Agrobacterium tumefaciens complex TaxID=1183400 RepID=A0AAE6EJ21_AGRTU|nr:MULTISPECIES: porin [Agrobacterium]MCA1866592.1 porin [Agrobacterium tomkonis]KNY36113.1 membrane protein [Agrobacterium sp. SUL3]MCA1876943.1 porin [Agrobacterium tumefaciens]MCA1892558.1 porin [Agrobacterium tomkonis]MCA2373828.1 porin [Agrobacterium tomkonis CIP 111-78]
MNIKSLLIGSAAALAAVSGAQAADAIVAAEPEPLEYVRVCDAFGTGFFYIPGTETCLKFQGYVRFQTDFGRDKKGTSDWNSFTRAQFEVDTRTDTELGALRGFIGFRGNADNGTASGSSVFVDQAFIELGGLKVGKFYSWWDDGLSGETDELSSNALFNSIRYTYDAGSFWAGASVDELEGINVQGFNEADNNVGIALGVGAKLGAASFQLIGGYDTDRENGSVRLIATADVGPGTLGLAGVWASGANAYYNVSEWAVAAEYAIKATDKLTITPGVQYYGNYGLVSWDDFSNDDGWKAGLTLDYKITQGLSTKIAVNYTDIDNRDDQVSGFVRLQRSF